MTTTDNKQNCEFQPFSLSGRSTRKLVVLPLMKKPSSSIVPERVTAMRIERNLSQKELAEEVGVTQQAINAIEAGDVRRPTKLFEIAAALGVDINYLLGLQDHQFVDSFEIDPPAKVPGPSISTRIPDLAIFAGMGGGGYLEVSVDATGHPTDPDQIRGYWEFPDYMLRRFGNLRNIYAWEVRGDSMEPTLFSGSVVFVDTAQKSPPPDDIYAIDAGDGLVVKRLRLVPRSSHVEIISDNARYPADKLLRDEVTVWGRIVGAFQFRG